MSCSKFPVFVLGGVVILAMALVPTETFAQAKKQGKDPSVKSESPSPEKSSATDAAKLNTFLSLVEQDDSQIEMASTNLLKGAEKHYSEKAQKNQLTEVDFYPYIRILEISENLEEAQKQAKVFFSTFPQSRFKAKVEKLQVVRKMNSPDSASDGSSTITESEDPAPVESKPLDENTAQWFEQNSQKIEKLKGLQSEFSESYKNLCTSLDRAKNELVPVEVPDGQRMIPKEENLREMETWLNKCSELVEKITEVQGKAEFRDYESFKQVEAQARQMISQ